jgi:hypothetical protein
MKLSEYIKHLQDILDTCGDLPCIYSSDDEGNTFRFLDQAPSYEFAVIEDDYYIELIDPEEADGDPFTEVCLVN